MARKEDLNPCSPVMDHHQRSNHGNKNIIEHMAYFLRFPFNFDDFCYCSQIVQAESIRTAVEHWRRIKPHCMGTIYWQVNDCWPAASWSSIDYAGRWKALHYAARRFYAPLLASSRLAGDALEVWATSDLPSELNGQWKAEVWTFDGRRAKAFRGAWELKELGSRAVAAIPLPEVFDEGLTKTSAFVTFEIRASARSLVARERRELGVETEKLVSENTRLFAPPKAIDLDAPGVRFRVEDGPDGRPLVCLNAQKPALFVELSTGALRGVLSDNWLHLVPDREVAVEFRGKEPIDAAELRKVLRVRSLYDSYQG
ncbi:MAG: hypothetical protein NTW86_08575 [Candidatus Sumerlaeota bacterium]|nr:hypothetical protein [Candidatus Sumerlaeota bacterium]